LNQKNKREVRAVPLFAFTVLFRRFNELDRRDERFRIFHIFQGTRAAAERYLSHRQARLEERGYGYWTHDHWIRLGDLTDFQIQEACGPDGPPELAYPSPIGAYHEEDAYDAFATCPFDV
jgi:hypothetical protein